MLLQTLFMIVCGLTAVTAQRVLALPDPKSCAKRVKHALWTDPLGNTHNYFFSWLHPATASLEVDWLDARNVCRRHCMDAVSLETLQENEFIKQQLARCKLFYIIKLLLLLSSQTIVNGWFWSGSEAKVPPTDQRALGDWSNTGGDGRPQPDNREDDEGEPCLAILNNFYNDGIKWHDVACSHEKPFICEDSEQLLNFVRSRNPEILNSLNMFEFIFFLTTRLFSNKHLNYEKKREKQLIH
uniref:C-type lectin domain-containing protein n=1 Tax=Daphnia galeata TaxID=27404 RepID=A0A8J2RI40_9CRUS|nr:unnamed protein product [Daphnia galeata]